KLIIVGKEKELTYEDDYGEVETVRKPVKRIVTGWLDSTEILKALDAEDKIAGIDKYTAKNTILYPEISKLPLVGSPFVSGIDAEAVLNVNPDAFYLWVATSRWAGGSTSYPGKSGKREFERKLPGVTLICLDVGNPDTFAENVRKLGYILDRRDVAEELINFYEETLNTIKDQTAGISEDEKRRVYMERGWGSYGLFGTPILCEIAGGKNIAADLPSGVKVDAEWVMVQNPDIIIKGKGEYGGYLGFLFDDPSELRAIREEMLNRLELAEVTAVKNGDVYVIDAGHLTIGPGTFIGAVYFAKWFYPELFEDLDPNAIHQEYLDRFMRIDYDLNKHGVFVYPPLEG
ncbi:MAG: ABC transporter substrate-binding protein, partial [Methanophagales archaeon]|nr:ABC transporter substrate-binding protein [Methanophagales archaeon]